MRHTKDWSTISFSLREYFPVDGRLKTSSRRGEIGAVRPSMENDFQRCLGGPSSRSGAQSGVQRTTPSVVDSAAMDPVPGRPGPPPTRTHYGSCGEGSSRDCPEPEQPWFLQHAVSSSETRADPFVAAGDRPLDFKQIPGRTSFSHGDSQVREGIYSTDGLYHVDRSHGRVSAHPDTQVVQTLPEICVSGGGLPVLCPAVWLGHRPLRLYSGNEAGGGCTATQPHPLPCLSGRLAVPAPGTGSTSLTDQCNHGIICQARPACKCPKIADYPVSGFCLPGLPLFDQPGISVTRTGPGGEISPNGSQVSGVRLNVLPNVDDSTGPDVLNGGPGTTRKLVDAATSMATSETPFANEHSRISASPDRNELRKTPSATDSAESNLEARSPNITVQSEEISLYGRQSPRLGSPPGRLLCRRDMGSQTSRSPHQSAREQSCSTSTQTLSPVDQRPECSTVYGQHDNSGLCQQRGGHEIVVTNVSGSGDSPVVPEKQHKIQSDPHTRITECSSGRSLQIQSGDTVRMGTPSPDSPEHLADPVEASDRPVRDTLEQETTAVHVPISGRPSGSGRCTIAELGGTKRVRVSSLQHSQQSSRQNRKLPGSTDNSDSPSMGDSAVVRKDKTAKHRRANASTDVAKPLKSTRVPFDPRSLEYIKASRVDVIGRALKARGFHTRAAEFMANSVRRSSERVYQLQWSAFVKWCLQEELNPFRVSTPKLSQFFTYLFDVKNLQVNSIRSYVTVVIQTIQTVTGKDISMDEINRMLAPPKEDIPCMGFIFST